MTNTFYLYTPEYKIDGLSIKMNSILSPNQKSNDEINKIYGERIIDYKIKTLDEAASAISSICEMNSLNHGHLTAPSDLVNYAEKKKKNNFYAYVITLWSEKDDRTVRTVRFFSPYDYFLSSDLMSKFSDSISRYILRVRDSEIIPSYLDPWLFDEVINSWIDTDDIWIYEPAICERDNFYVNRRSEYDVSEKKPIIHYLRHKCMVI